VAGRLRGGEDRAGAGGSVCQLGPQPFDRRLALRARSAEFLRRPSSQRVRRLDELLDRPFDAEPLSLHVLCRERSVEGRLGGTTSGTDDAHLEGPGIPRPEALQASYDALGARRPSHLGERSAVLDADVHDASG